MLARRTHLGEKRLTKIYSVPAIEQGSYMKPTGLWYAIDDDWRRWSRDEDHKIFEVETELNIDLSRVLAIRSPEELLKFHKETVLPNAEKTYTWDPNKTWSFDWGVVAEEYAGIEIAPYIWKHRLDLGWYYTWDCASGCVWDANAVKIIESCE